jgi:hypothetical protein
MLNIFNFCMKGGQYKSKYNTHIQPFLKNNLITCHLKKSFKLRNIFYFIGNKMSASKDSICARISRLNQQLLSPYCQDGAAVNTKLHVEGLQDALLALYEECNCERLKKIPEISSFLEKCKSL